MKTVIDLREAKQVVLSNCMGNGNGGEQRGKKYSNGTR